jgi:hypothetical protein
LAPVATDWSLTAINSLLASRLWCLACELDEVNAHMDTLRRPPQVYIVIEEQNEVQED